MPCGKAHNTAGRHRTCGCR